MNVMKYNEYLIRIEYSEFSLFNLSPPPLHPRLWSHVGRRGKRPPIISNPPFNEAVTIQNSPSSPPSPQSQAMEPSQDVYIHVFICATCHSKSCLTILTPLLYHTVIPSHMLLFREANTISFFIIHDI